MQKIKKVLDDYSTIELDPRWRSKGHTAIGNKIMFNKKLTPYAKLIYWLLLIRCFSKDNSFPSNKSMAKDIGISVWSIKTHKKLLLESGLISMKRRGQGKTNVYILKF